MKPPYQSLVLLFTLIASCVFSQVHLQVGMCKHWSSNGYDTTYSREVTSFDSTGNIIYFENDEMYYPTDTAWAYIGRTVYTYDSLNRKTSQTPYMFYNNSWNPVSNRTTYLYGANQLLIEETSQQYNAPLYVNYEQFISGYNANNDLISYEKRTWNVNTWDNVTKTTYVYDTAHHMLEQYSLNWNTGVYDTIGFTIYQYQFNGPQIYSVLRVNTQWGNTDSTKTVYYYDTSGRDSVVYTFGCSSPACSDTSVRDVYVYTAPFDTTIYHYSWQGGSWPMLGTITKKYNLSGFITEDSNGGNGSGSGTQYYYDANNLLLRKFSYRDVTMHPTNYTECIYSDIYTDSLHVQSSSPDSLCQQDSVFIILSITGGTMPYSISWQDSLGYNRSLRWLNPDNNATTYYYTVTDSSGQVFSDSIEVYRHLLPADTVLILGSSSICPGDTITLSYFYPASVNETWRQGNVWGYDPQFTVTDTGMVFLYANYTTANCPYNPFHSSVNIELQEPHPSFGNDTLICINQPLILDPGSFNTYTWQDNSTSPTFLVTNNIPGTYNYFVTVTDSNNCMSNTDSISVTIDLCSGVSDENILMPYLYPNPFDDYIKLNGSMSTNIFFSIYDSKGIKVKNGHLINENIIESGELSKGIYFINVYDRNFNITRKIIKN